MKIIGAGKSYGEKRIFDNLDFEIEEGKVTAIMGSSGIGKTTLLKMIAGLTDYEGTIELEGNISYVFGEASLIPALTVKQNLEYAVSHVITDIKLRLSAIENILKEVELAEEASRYPAALSTGMAQRVSLARGFLYPASTIVMDEPLRGLDTALKSKLQNYFLKLLSKDKKTIVLITHDITEALLLSDRIVVFGGRPVEIKGDIKIKSPREARNLSDPEIALQGDKLLKILENQ